MTATLRPPNEHDLEQARRSWWAMYKHDGLWILEIRIDGAVRFMRRVHDQETLEGAVGWAVRACVSGPAQLGPIRELPDKNGWTGEIEVTP